MLSKNSGLNLNAFHITRCTLVILGVLMLAGCSPYVKYYPYAFDRDSAPAVKKVAIAPWNLLSPMPDYVRGKETRIDDALIVYLKDHSVAAEPCKAAGTIWNEQKREAGGIYDSYEGRVDTEKLRVAIRSTVSRICAAEEVDAVVFPEIVVRRATLEGTAVVWDGTVQKIDVAKGSEDFFPANWNGESFALSLVILIIDKNNRLVLRNVAGIEHPFEAVREGTAPKWKKRKDLLTDSARIHHAIAVSLHPLIPFSGYPEKPAFSKESTNKD
jgi:hypothetical protein